MAGTYRDFIEGIREIADDLEEIVKDSQIISLNDEMASEDDDTIFFYFDDMVKELLSNITGVHR